MISIIESQFLESLRENIHHFHALNAIVADYGTAIHNDIVSYMVKGSFPKYNNYLSDKQYLLYTSSIGKSNIVEIGTDYGHSLLLMLMANKTAQFDVIDVVGYPFTEKCVAYLRKHFQNRINFHTGCVVSLLDVWKNDHKSFDLIHFNGSQKKDTLFTQLRSVLKVCCYMPTIVFDDTDKDSFLIPYLTMHFQTQDVNVTESKCEPRNVVFRSQQTTSQIVEPSISYPNVILTTFAGRRMNLEVLTKYTDYLYAKGLLHEVHFWDFTRDRDDALWLQNKCGRKTLRVMGYNYVDTEVTLDKDSNVPLHFLAYEDAYIALQDDMGNVVCEIALGAYGNSICLIRKEKQGNPISAVPNNICLGGKNKWACVTLLHKNDKIMVLHEDNNGQTQVILSMPLDIKSSLKVLVGAWANNVVKWKVPLDTSYMKVKHVINKRSWQEYYQHYTKERYPNHVILKCDDDIVFIDVNSFEDFIINTLKEDQYTCRFASTVNNGVCAHLQQQWCLIPRSLSEFPYDTLQGKLWSDGVLCQNLHEYFIQNHDAWLQSTRTLQPRTHVVPIGDRLSINFFAICSKHLPFYQKVGDDDEKQITVDLTKQLHVQHAIDKNFTVSHLAFFKQRATGLEEEDVIKLYDDLATKYLAHQ